MLRILVYIPSQSEPVKMSSWLNGQVTIYRKYKPCQQRSGLQMNFHREGAKAPAVYNLRYNRVLFLSFLRLIAPMAIYLTKLFKQLQRCIYTLGPTLSLPAYQRSEVLEVQTDAATRGIFLLSQSERMNFNSGVAPSAFGHEYRIARILYSFIPIDEYILYLP